MAWITDSLRSAIAALNPFSRNGLQPLATDLFTHQLAVAAYMSSGMLRKVIAIPAEDRVREWRDWQAEADQIEKIEAEERRLGLAAKVKFAEVLRGVGGGALVLITAEDHATPLDLDRIRAGGLVAINVVSRWQIQGQDWVDDLASPDYGTPRMFQISSRSAGQNLIHPSRVICFRGDPLPCGETVSDEEAFWGDSRLLRVFREVQKADNAQAWFAELVKKAKLLRFGIPGLSDMDAKKVEARVAMIAQGESILNATVFESAATKEGAGETVSDYQITWAGIPAMMDAFDQRVAAVADIPFTRLMGRSPAGMNATGESDQDNWNKMVVSGQKLETRPCLEKLDPVLLRSAGVDPAKVTWAFAPLDVPSEKEQADTFKTTMEAVEKAQNTGAIPDEAFAKGLQNLMIEREWMPGLDQALAEIPEDQRYGIEEEPEADPLAVEQMRAAGTITEAQADALLTDAAPRTLYVQRKLLNAAEFIAWAKAQGFETTTTADELHVTVTFSRQPVNWLKMGDTWAEHGDGKLTVNAGGPRMVEKLGDKGAVVLLFASSQLSWRHEEMVRNGASWDFPEYQPHVTITYKAPEGLDLSKVEPYRGKLVFGPELFAEIVEDWEKGLVEDYNPNQPRDPAGTSTGGQWAGGGAVLTREEALKKIAQEGKLTKPAEVAAELERQGIYAKASHPDVKEAAKASYKNSLSPERRAEMAARQSERLRASAAEAESARIAHSARLARANEEIPNAPMMATFSATDRERVMTYLNAGDVEGADAEGRLLSVKSIANQARAEGWSTRHTSKEGTRTSSRYLVHPNGNEVRVSDHYIPQTERREFMGSRSRWKGELVVGREWRSRQVQAYMDDLNAIATGADEDNEP